MLPFYFVPAVNEVSMAADNVVYAGQPFIVWIHPSLTGSMNGLDLVYQGQPFVVTNIG